jgi:hypothetical protein
MIVLQVEVEVALGQEVALVNILIGKLVITLLQLGYAHQHIFALITTV